MKVYLYVIYLLLWTAIAYSQNPNRSTRLPAKDTGRSGSKFLDEFVKSYQNQQHYRDSLNKYFREHPMETNTYISKFLIDRRVLPNNDAIEFIKALNPEISNLPEINYYAELKMPFFKQLKRPDRKRLRKEHRRLNKYDKESQRIFTTQYNKLEGNISEFNKTGIRSGSRNDFSNTLNDIHGQLRLLKDKRMTKGITVFITNQLSTMNLLVADVINQQSITPLQMAVLNDIKKDIDRPSLRKVSSISPNKNPWKRGVWITASAESEDADENEDIFRNNYSAYAVGEDDVSSKICGIYAMTVTGSGNKRHQEDINLGYFYSYKTGIDATYKCKTGTCEGFVDQPGLVSANGANIIPANYLFRFRSHENGQIYFRCISKDMFEKIQQTAGGLNKNRFRIIFYPQSDECKAYLPH